LWAGIKQGFANRGNAKAQAAAKENSKFFADAVYKQWARDSVSLAGASPQEYNKNLIMWLNNKWGANGQLKKFIQTAVQQVNPANQNTVYSAIQQVVDRNALVQNTTGLNPQPRKKSQTTAQTNIPADTSNAGQDTLQSLSQRVGNLEKALSSQGSLVEHNFSAILWNKK
jgi:hypothetical protein